MTVGLSVGKLRDCLITESPMTAEAFFPRNTPREFGEIARLQRDVMPKASLLLFLFSAM